MLTAIRLYMTLGFMFLSLTSLAKEDSRPLSSSKNSLVELTLGTAFEDDEAVYEVGLDYEYFIPSMDHHLSIGIASEVEFLNDGPEYLFAPLFSLYYYHMKVFISSGFITDFSNKSRWKSRFGFGYEFFIDKHDYIVVPTLAWDVIESEQYPVVVIGVAREF